jgi:hypothetical protein
MLEYSTKIDDFIPCQRGRMSHSKFVEYANILLIPCHLTSALPDVSQADATRATLTFSLELDRSSSSAYSTTECQLIRHLAVRPGAGSPPVHGLFRNPPPNPACPQILQFLEHCRHFDKNFHVHVWKLTMLTMRFKKGQCIIVSWSTSDKLSKSKLCCLVSFTRASYGTLDVVSIESGFGC